MIRGRFLLLVAAASIVPIFLAGWPIVGGITMGWMLVAQMMGGEGACACTVSQ